MQEIKCNVTQGPGGYLINEKGERLTPPKDWEFLPAGDAGITRKVTSAGKYWRVQFRKGRRIMSKGIWAPSVIIEKARKEMQTTRLTDDYKKRKIYESERRQKKQDTYELEFCNAVEDFLNFHSIHKNTQKLMANAITAHAIPVGSGTVARTSMIPLEERAAKAVIAWMRHQTTAYENLTIQRIKGERRAVRRQLAQQSVALLEKYRRGESIPDHCPLQKALKKSKVQSPKYCVLSPKSEVRNNEFEARRAKLT